MPRDVTYVNAHGTGTKQNDLLESRGIRAAFGRAANSVCVSANKAMLGHLVNASGSVELAITALALRDGFAPPTLNLTHPDPECDLDCIPLLAASNRSSTRSNSRSPSAAIWPPSRYVAGPAARRSSARCIAAAERRSVISARCRGTLPAGEKSYRIVYRQPKGSPIRASQESPMNFKMVFASNLQWRIFLSRGI